MKEALAGSPAHPSPREALLDNGVFYRHWPAAGDLQGVLLLAHGLGEHSGRYQQFAAFFAARGYAVVAPDHPGHGASPGRRAYVSNFEDFLQPLLQLRADIASWYPAADCFLVGHSLGGLIAARLLLQAGDCFAGAVLSGAALAVAQPPPVWLLWLNRLLSRVWPTLGMMQLDPGQISRDPEVVAAYRADPLVHHGKVSARLVAELFAAMRMVSDRQQEITLPMLVLHGAADVMTAPAGSESFCSGAGNRSLRIYPGLFHEIFNEPERLQVLDDVHEWLRAQARAAAD
ncbi:alpha/beta hydrolase [Kineobactrum salinum]|uniref:Monoacylglycerol lipase n=1 Tax=Kineobactrum salinum TaxID=2708301 RepID=A0A6C0U0Z6_9GAMM|nr:alpha/beta hydrolase [Kineobactrum salinum]QIB65701.1 alpha/beta hydrolase [Kineobactrum salinum]